MFVWQGSTPTAPRTSWAAGGGPLRYGDHEKLISGAEKNTTNNRMELTAAVMALRALKRPCVVHLYTDSQYLKKAFTDGWLEKWQKNGWKTASRQPVKNQDLREALLEEATRHRVIWHWQKDHAGRCENELVDREAQRRRRTLPLG